MDEEAAKSGAGSMHELGRRSASRKRRWPERQMAEAAPVHKATKISSTGHIDLSIDPPSILQDMKHDKELQDFCDVVFTVGDERFPAHKVVLAASSEVFKAMFTIDMKERRARDITLEWLDPDSWRVTLEYMYSAKVDIADEEMALLVLTSAHMYQVEKLVKFLETFLIGRLSLFNCTDMLVNAEFYNLVELKAVSMRMLEKKFEAIAMTQAFLRCPRDLLTMIIHSDRIIIVWETSVLQALTRWIAHDEEHRSEDLDSMLGIIRVGEMNDFELAMALTTKGHNLVAARSSKFRTTLIKSLVQFRMDPDGARKLLASGFHMRPRKRNERRFTFWHLLRGIRKGSFGNPEDLLLTPWATDATNGLKWRLQVYPEGEGAGRGKFMSMFLQVQSVVSRDKNLLDVQAQFDIFLVNRMDCLKTISFPFEFHFTPTEDDWGFPKFVDLSRLTDVDEGFVDENTDSILVGASVTFC